MKKLGFRKIVAGVIAVTLCFGLYGGVGLHNGTEGSDLKSESPHNPIYDANTDTTDWDYVYFGNYPQTQLVGSDVTEEIVNAQYDENGDTVVNGVKYRRLDKKSATYASRDVAKGFFDWDKVDGEYAYFKYEPIKWRVLQNEGDTLLLLSDLVIDDQKYERSDGKVTWETSSVRTWLNGYSPYSLMEGYNFLTAAFTDEEQDAIVRSDLNNAANPFHNTNGGNATSDKIFLLSVDEMTNESYGFPSAYMDYSSTRQLQASGYAKAMGVWMGSHNDLYDGNAIWMLRTPGSYQQTVSLVYWFGHVYQDGYYANEGYYGVAPAIRISAKSDLWKPVDSDAQTNIQKITINSYKMAASRAEFTLNDAKKALRIAVGIDKGTDEEIKLYDLHGNGNVDLNEVKIILKVSVGIMELPAEFQSPPPTNTLPPSEIPTSPTPIEPEPPVTHSPPPEETEEPLVQKDCDASGKIWIAGDSIADYHSKSGYSQPLYGWGELIGDYFENSRTLKFSNNINSDKKLQSDAAAEADYSVYINNTALSSRSSASFTSENNYTSLKDTMGEGDYLLISFGHNDERADVNLYTDPFGTSSDKCSFKWYLKTYYIDPAIRAGVQPVLISPVTRRYFYNGKFINPQLHTTYGKAMKELSEEYSQIGIRVYYIDLHSHMLDLYETLGENGTIELHGKYGNTMDNTHLSQKGATIVCDYIIQEMVKQNMNISKYIKQDYKNTEDIT